MSEEMEGVDQLLLQWVTRKEMIQALIAELDALGAAINAQAGNEEVTEGDVTLEGNKLKAVVTRKVNVKYTDKKKLADLLVAHKAVLGPLFRIEIKESGEKVNKFLVTGETQIVNELKAIRESNAGKPSIEVQPIKIGL